MSRNRAPGGMHTTGVGSFPNENSALIHCQNVVGRRDAHWAKSRHETNGASSVMCSQGAGGHASLTLAFRNSTLTIYPAQLADVRNMRFSSS